jgi:hypothetical protein
MITKKARIVFNYHRNLLMWVVWLITTTNAAAQFTFTMDQSIEVFDAELIRQTVAGYIC